MNGHFNCVALLKTVFSKFLFVMFFFLFVPKFLRLDYAEIAIIVISPPVVL